MVRYFPVVDGSLFEVKDGKIVRELPTDGLILMEVPALCAPAPPARDPRCTCRPDWSDPDCPAGW